MTNVSYLEDSERHLRHSAALSSAALSSLLGIHFVQRSSLSLPRHYHHLSHAATSFPMWSEPFRNSIAAAQLFGQMVNLDDSSSYECQSGRTVKSNSIPISFEPHKVWHRGARAGRMSDPAPGSYYAAQKRKCVDTSPVWSFFEQHSPPNSLSSSSGSSVYFDTFPLDYEQQEEVNLDDR